MSKFAPIAIISGLVLMSFFGAVVMSHESGQMGCLASDLLLATPCPAGIGQLGAATFHVGLFLSLFQIIFIASVILGILIFLFRLNLFFDTLTRARVNFFEKFLSSSPPLSFGESRWLTLCNHSPTF